MKKLRTAGALLLALTLTLSLAACAGGGGAPAAQTPDEVIAAAQKKMEAVKSMDAAMTMEMGMSMDGESLEMAVAMNMSIVTDPMQMKIEMNLDMGELGSQQMNMYMTGEEDSYVLYLGDGTNWYAQPVSADDIGQYDAQGSMDLYLGSTSDFQSAGTEQLPGGEADKFTGVIKGDSLAAVMEQSGALDSLSSVVGDTSALSDLYKDLGDLPVSVWVDKATGYPTRYEMDMTDFMVQVMNKAMLAAGATEADLETLKVEKMALVMDCTNFDNATPFTIPPEALAAAG